MYRTTAVVVYVFDPRTDSPLRATVSGKLHSETNMLLSVHCFKMPQTWMERYTCQIRHPTGRVSTRTGRSAPHCHHSAWLYQAHQRTSLSLLKPWLSTNAILESEEEGMASFHWQVVSSLALRSIVVSRLSSCSTWQRILITACTGNMNSTTWNSETKFASVQPGSHWQE